MNFPKPSKELFVGVVGNAASGKDTVAKLFVARGLDYVSVSDCVREEIIERGLEVNRSTQNTIANKMRDEVSLSFWIEKAIQKVNKSNPIGVVLSGIYAPSEGIFIREKLNGVLVGVELDSDEENDIENRYKRLVERSDGNRDDISKDEFLLSYKRENSGLSIHEANVASLFAMAEFVISNSNDFSYLELQVDNILSQISERQS